MATPVPHALMVADQNALRVAFARITRAASAARAGIDRPDTDDIALRVRLSAFLVEVEAELAALEPATPDLRKAA